MSTSNLILRADELRPGMVCNFEGFDFVLNRIIVEYGEENWVTLVPSHGVPMELECYTKVQVTYMPGWVQREFDASR